MDPLTALAGITSAISLCKKAAKVANDIGSLAPTIAKLFDATSVARKSMLEAKRSKNKSNLGIAKRSLGFFLGGLLGRLKG